MKCPESRKPSCTSMPHQYGNHEVTKDHNHCLHSHGSRHNTKHRADVCGRLDVPITSPSATYYITVFLYTYTVPILHTMKYLLYLLLIPLSFFPQQCFPFVAQYVSYKMPPFTIWLVHPPSLSDWYIPHCCK